MYSYCSLCKKTIFNNNCKHCNKRHLFNLNLYLKKYYST